MALLGTWFLNLGILGLLGISSACANPSSSSGGVAFESSIPGGNATPATPMVNPTGWWRQNTVFYQIWVSAFQNGSNLNQTATGNTGNLAGITAAIKANYFSNLGVNALWLSPVFDAASLTAGSGNKHGYDTTDYNDVASIYGTNQDLSNLISAAHQKNIRVVFDFVPNHTGDQNPWFTDSASSGASVHRSWYNWSPAVPNYPGPSNTSNWPGSDSSIWHPDNGSYYYGVFGSNMPDLNYANPDVSSTMQGVVKGWLDFGFDGMRVDAVRYLFEGTAPDTYADQPATHTWFDNLRSQVLDAYPANNSKFMMGEVWGYSASSQLATDLTYAQNGTTPEFNVVLDFIWPGTLINAVTSSGASAVSVLSAHMVGDCTQMQDFGADFGEFQSNHDLAASRPATAYNGNGPEIYLAAALDLLGQAMPIIYYGNEIAMPGNINSGSGPDTNMRQPFDWSQEATLATTTDSIWQWHQALIHLRTGYGAWDDPSISGLTASNTGVLAFEISSTLTAKKALVVANLSGGTASFTVGVSATTASGILGATLADSLTGGSLSVNALPADGVRVYALDDATPPASFLNHDPTPASYSAVLTLPAPSALYLRGTAVSEGWGSCDTGNLMTPSGTVYSLSISLSGGTTYQFKFADSTWGTYNYGHGTVSWDSGHSLPPGNSEGSASGNLTFTPASSGSYTFNFSFSATPTWWVQ